MSRDQQPFVCTASRASGDRQAPARREQGQTAKDEAAICVPFVRCLSMSVLEAVEYIGKESQNLGGAK
jgi:hypothetical protein